MKRYLMALCLLASANAVAAPCQPMLVMEGTTLQTGALNARLSKCEEGPNFVELEVRRILFPPARLRLNRETFSRYHSNLEEAHAQLKAIADKPARECFHPVEITFHPGGKPRTYFACPSTRGQVIAQFLDGMLLVLVSRN